MTHGTEGPAQQPASGDPVTPARVLATGDHPTPSCRGARGVDEGRLVGIPDRRQMLAAGGGEQHAAGYQRRGAVGLAHDVEEGNLADRRGDPPVLGGGGQRVAAAHRGPEGRDPLSVDPGQVPGAGDRRPPVLELALRLEEVGDAVAVAEAAVIEDEGGDPGGGKALRERPEPVAPGPGEAVRHDDRGRLAGSRPPPDRARPRNAPLRPRTRSPPGSWPFNAQAGRIVRSARSHESPPAAGCASASNSTERTRFATELA